jgi:hypothetical protein
MLTIHADAHPLMRRMHKPDPRLPVNAQDRKMARKAKELTALEVGRLKTPGQKPGRFRTDNQKLRQQLLWSHTAHLSEGRGPENLSTC